MARFAASLVLLALCCRIEAGHLDLEELDEAPLVALRGAEWSIRGDFSWEPGQRYTNNSIIFWEMRRNGKPIHNGSLTPLDEFGALKTTQLFNITDKKLGRHSYTLAMSLSANMINATEATFRTHVVPGGLTLLPPLFTVIAVLWSQNVLLSLYIGVYTACFLIYSYNPITAFARSIDTMIVESFADRGHVQVILFTWFLSGMIACVLKSGGGEGLVTSLSRYASTVRAGSLVTVGLGLCVFFDGIANTLIVGQSLRPFTDALSISREKLAFLVDGTSSPVTSLSPISTWVGFELSLIESLLESLKDAGEDVSCYDSSAFIIFVKTIPGRFYPFLIIAVQLLLIITGREFGPMLHAERRARHEGVAKVQANHKGLEDYAAMEPLATTPKRWWNAAVPVIVTTVMTIIGLLVTGVDACKAQGLELTGTNIFGNSDSYQALLYASLIGSFSIWFLSWAQRVDGDGHLVWFGKRPHKPILTWNQSLNVWIFGIQNLTFAILILLLAWSVGKAFTTAGTGTFLSNSLADSIQPGSYPALTFIISAILALVTGSSWGAMAILFPLILPAAHAAAPCNHDVFYGTIASILSGAVFGDHCSPISDTTILSAIACRCDLGAHVKTQAPYAVLCGLVGILVGELPTGYGAYSTGVGLCLSLLVVTVAAFLLSVPVESKKTDYISVAMDWLSEKLHVKRSLELGEDQESIIGPDADSANGEDDPLVDSTV
eukprot:m.70905 g.70905  ORF g.70905 m.70905 type:complete len:720 (+) comp14183_c0_seq1:100-2259(+)